MSLISSSEARSVISSTTRSAILESGESGEISVGIEQIARVQVDEEEPGVGPCRRPACAAEARMVRPSSCEPIEPFGGVEDGPRVRQRRLLAAQQRLVAEERASSARTMGWYAIHSVSSARSKLASSPARSPASACGCRAERAPRAS